jgi:uncharacterized protein
MPNRLSKENSPYLLQHAHNPVDWYPWGEAALQKSKLENKPILLSIGYAACHWCHVMAHESFENESIARMMNSWFVNIKVDREERPDLDSIYMQAVVSITGQGGWPMTVFLTPEGQPFFGGTYFPPAPRYGMPGFSQVLQSVAAAWRDRRDEVHRSASQIVEHLQTASQNSNGNGSQALTTDLLDQAVGQLTNRFDSNWGGFSPAPKFPQPMVIEFLLRETIRTGNPQALQMAEFTLEKMALGGIYDHLGGGFARYSTDDRWLVPHFEKMLYDNAQLARLFLHAWQIEKKPLYRKVVEETLDYIQREMTHPDGGFYSSQDADSEGEEGKFYVWSQKEIDQVLGEDAQFFSEVYGVTKAGNWEGKNILYLEKSPEEIAGDLGTGLNEIDLKLGSARRKLFGTRNKRVFPGLDDKVTVSWNGLAMAAFAEAGSILERKDYLDTATRNAKFLYHTMRTEPGRLLRTWKAGSTAKNNGFLEDYAFLAEGLLTLYQAGFEEHWFEWARNLADQILVHFQDEENGGFYDTADDHEQLIQRPKELQDNAIPSGNARAVHVLLKLGMFTGQEKYILTAERAIQPVVGLLERYPFGFGEWLSAVSFYLSRGDEVALIGTKDEIHPFLQVIHETYRPFTIIAVGQELDANKIPLLLDRPKVNDLPTAYVCRQFVCQSPVTDVKVFAGQLVKS